MLAVVTLSLVLVYTDAPSSPGKAFSGDKKPSRTAAVLIPSDFSDAVGVDRERSPRIGDYSLPKEQAVEEISRAMRMYSDEAVAKILKFLDHSDLEIRKVATEALKQIRSSRSAAALRKAAAQSQTGRERNLLLRAAEFTELPLYDANRLRNRTTETRVVD